MRSEYFGLPGTGKSYLCRELIEYFATTGNKSVTVSGIIEDQSYLIFNLNKIRYATMFIVSKPSTVWRTIHIAKKYGLKSNKQFCTKLINLFAEVKKTESDKGQTVIEQGVLQGIWSLQMLSHGNIANELLDELLNWLPNQVIVVLPPNDQFYIEQLTNRDKGQSHFDTLTADEISQSINAASKSIDEIIDLARSKKADLKVLTLVNDHRLNAADTGQWICNESE